MAKKQNIFLVGLMGVGKTSIGKALARELDMEFYDADVELEQRTGVSVAWIFEVEGEAGFRRRESKIIDELTQKENVILATGGGVVLREENRKALTSRGIVIYLQADLQYLLERTARVQTRPLLTTGDPAEILKKLFDQRDPLYRQIADFIFTTNDGSVTEIAKRIVRDLKEKQL